ANAEISGVSNLHGFDPYGTITPAESPTNSLSEPLSKPITGNPQARDSMTEFGQGGFTSAQYIKCDERINCGIFSRGTVPKNFIGTLLCNFFWVCSSTVPATMTSIGIFSASFSATATP